MRGREAGGILEILDADGNAGQWARIAASGDHLIDPLRLLEGPMSIDGHERVDLGVQHLDPLDVVCLQLQQARPPRGAGELGRGLAGFADEIGPAAWDNTVVVCISEFGRTFKENGNGGTDHGHGSAYWILGGKVNGGKVLGDQVRVERASLNQDRDLPVKNEYRAMFGGLFERMYGLDQTRLAAVFPQAEARDLGIV